MSGTRGPTRVASLHDGTAAEGKEASEEMANIHQRILRRNGGGLLVHCPRNSLELLREEAAEGNKEKRYLGHSGTRVTLLRA